jgi:tartrate-resistant acid phosphatase type 5
MRKNYIAIFFIVLCQAILLSCSKLDLISPVGFATKIEADSIVFAVIGDYGLAGEAEEKVSTMVKSWNPDFIITTGDNNYETGEFSTIKANISKYYSDYIYNFDAPEEYRCNGKAFTESINRFFPSPGNHDANNADNLVPYLNFFTLPEQEIYYKFIWGSVSFYSLNSVADNIDDQKQWLYEQLSISSTPYNIVYFHHSPYTTGNHGNTDKMQLDYYNHHVDVVLTGHDHIYARIQKKSEQGMYYIVNGLGGRSIHDINSVALPADEFDTYSYNADYGAIKATSTKNKLVLEFFSAGQPDQPVDRVVIEK